MTTEIVKPEEPRGVQLGTIWAASPEAVIAKASNIAGALTDIIEGRKLYSVISRRKYVRVEGWSTLGAMLGVLPREVEVTEHENGDFEATVELIRASDGAVVGRGSAICGVDENTWANRPRYARRSMAITRATGKAFRLGFSWIIQLAGYEATPAEEVDGVVDGEVREVSKPKPAAKKNGNGHKWPERPWDAETVRDYLTTVKVPSYKGPADASDKQRKFALSCLAGISKDDAKRHSVTAYLFEKDSIKDLTGAECSAIIDWVQPDEEYQPHPHAIDEFERIVTARVKELGQGEMVLPA